MFHVLCCVISYNTTVATKMPFKSKKKIKRQNISSDSEEESKTVLHPLNIGKLPMFNVHTEDWCVYEDIWSSFLRRMPLKINETCRF